MSVCCWYSSSTCCDNTALSVLERPITAAMDYLADAGLSPASRCYWYLYGLSCIYCSSTTGQYFTVNSTTHEIDVQLCNTVCDKIWDYCRTEMPKNSSLPNSTLTLNATNAGEICALVSEWLSQTLIKVGITKFRFSSASSSCFTPYNTFIISQSNCVPNYQGVGYGIPLWALPLVALGVFILLIGVCVGFRITIRKRKARVVADQIEISSAFDPDEEQSDDDSSLRYYYYSATQRKRKSVE